MVTNTLMLRTLFWLWCMHSTWVVDCAHQTPCSCHGHLNICPTMAQRFVSQHTRNWWRWKSLDVKLVLWGGRSLTSQPQHHKQSRSRCHCGAQQLPYFWTPQEEPGWQVVCCRCHHEASCHLLPAGAWWQFLLCWKTGLGGMVGQTLTCCWWIGEGVMRLMCYPWVMCTLKPA